MGDKEDIRDVLPEELRLEDNIPEELCYDIVEQARGNEHYSCVYRVAKWGKIEERAFLNTYGEIQELPFSVELLQYKPKIIEEIRRGEKRKRIMRQEIRQKMGNFLSYFVEGRQFLLVEVYHITRGICNHIVNGE